jgi:hypothetical protein
MLGEASFILRELSHLLESETITELAWVLARTNTNIDEYLDGLPWSTLAQIPNADGLKQLLSSRGVLF